MLALSRTTCVVGGSATYLPLRCSAAWQGLVVQVLDVAALVQGSYVWISMPSGNSSFKTKPPAGWEQGCQTLEPPNNKLPPPAYSSSVATMSRERDRSPRDDRDADVSYDPAPKIFVGELLLRPSSSGIAAGDGDYDVHVPAAAHSSPKASAPPLPLSAAASAPACCVQGACPFL